MNRDEILNCLREHRTEIGKRFAVTRLGLFGSAARDELGEESDVDMLVAFEGFPTFAGYLGLKHYLEQLLDRPVDLVTESGLKARAKLTVEKDLIRVP